MLGAIIGDIVGSRFEWNNIKTKEFTLLTEKCFITDDSVMTVAVAKALLECRISFTDLEEKAVLYMQRIGNEYPDSGYGGNFFYWLRSKSPKPYNSWGNGAAMRVSACGWYSDSLEKVIQASHLVTGVTHNHKEGIKGAEAVAVAIYLARMGKSMEEIKEEMKKYYTIDFTLEEIRDSYKFDESCQGTVPYALEAFFESVSFEDAIRNAISIGGDSDTLAAITGSIAEAYYGIPLELRNKIFKYYLPKDLAKIIMGFEESFPPKIIYNDKELLVKNLKIIRERIHPFDHFENDYERAFYNGFEDAFNYVFALLEVKEEIKVSQGDHPETYIKRVKRFTDK